MPARDRSNGEFSQLEKSVSEKSRPSQGQKQSHHQGDDRPNAKMERHARRQPQPTTVAEMSWAALVVQRKIS